MCQTCGNPTHDVRLRARGVVAAALSGVSATPAAPKTWNERYPAEAKWLVANCAKSNFAASLLDGVRKYGSLTPRQLETVQRIVREDAAKAAAPVAAQPTVDIAKIATALTSARQHILYPKLRLAGFVFSLASASSPNAGAVYVKTADDVYLGKIISGRFSASRDCTPAQAQAVIAAAADPEAAAVAYGQAYGICSCCGRTLTNAESIARGIGPICATRFGW